MKTLNINKILLVVLCVVIAGLIIALTVLIAFSGSNSEIKWKSGTVSGTYTLDDLKEMTDSQRGELKKKFIAVEFELESYGTLNGLFYANSFQQKIITAPNPSSPSNPSTLTIICYVYEPYWEIKCEIGDTVIAKGYVEYFSKYDSPIGGGYTTKTIRLNPCDISKK